jgi:hypothetical protein
MSKTKFILTLLLLAGLGAWCLYLNRDWFRSEPIQITHRVSPWMRGAPGRRADPLNRGNTVVFAFNAFYCFNDIKVVVAADADTNKYAHPLWHLVSSSNSVLTMNFAYGERIRGMMPEVKGAITDPLEPGVQYRLLVETDRGPAAHNFTTTPKP